MSHRWRLAILVVLAVAAGVFLVAAVAPFDLVRGRLDAVAGDGSAEPYTPQLHNRLQIYFSGLGLLIMAGGGLLILDGRRAKYERSFLTRLASDGRVLWHDAVAAFVRHAALLVGVLGVALIARAPYLTQPIRYDEAHSFVNYANWPAFVTVSTYQEPNNHIFHNVCVHAVTRLLGPAEWAVRLPAFLAGVLVVPAICLLGASWSGRAVGVLSALAVACSSPLIEYSSNARGYSMQGLLLVILVLVGQYAIRTSNAAAWGLMSLLAAIGFWTVPTMLYPYAMLITWLVLLWWWQRRSVSKSDALWKPLGGHVLLTILLTLGLYSPVLVVNGATPFVSSRYVESLSWTSFADRLPQLVVETRRLLFRDQSLVSVPLLMVGWLAVLRPGQLRRSAPPSLLLLSTGVCLALVIVQRVLPPACIWTPIWPLMLTIACCGLVSFTDNRQRKFRAVLCAAVVLLLCVVPMIQLTRSDSIRTSRETGTFPDAEAAVLWMIDSLHPREPVVTIVPSSAPLVYYALRHSLPLTHFEWPGGPNTRSDIALIVVNDDWGQTIAARPGSPEAAGLSGRETVRAGAEAAVGNPVSDASDRGSLTLFDQPVDCLLP